MPPRGQRVDQLVEGPLTRQRHHPFAVGGFHQLDHPADQPRPGPGRGVCLRIQDLLDGCHQPGVRPPRRLPGLGRPLVHQPSDSLPDVARPSALHGPNRHPQLPCLRGHPLHQREGCRVIAGARRRARCGAERQPGLDLHHVPFPLAGRLLYRLRQRRQQP
ncbi:hypothetical protein QR97_22030 [Streptomyces sp. PBH53]|nr:hypothetical protein QR97_22030 [Streptomyces sp. PBH53]